MVVERPLAVGRGGAGEIERAQPAGADGVPTTFTTLGSLRSSSRNDLGGNGADIGLAFVERF